jgi:ABC-2 type transport system ATP-binding protein
MLQFTRVEKFFGSVKVLSIPSLELPLAIYWLEGPNGSGKTTLLRVLAGILPFRGQIRLRGISLRREPTAYRRLTGWADAEPLYPDFLTGADLLAFYRDIIWPPAGQLNDLIGRFGVSAWLGSKAVTWSAGMCKKISLLLAFMGRPALIMLDEPLITVDGSGSTAVLDLVKERYDKDGTAFILSSHQLDLNGEIPDLRRLIIHNGSINLI